MNDVITPRVPRLEQLNLRARPFAEWHAKAQSPAYRAIEKKLAARPQLTPPPAAPPPSPSR